MSQSVPEPADQTMKIDVAPERSFASGRYVVRRVLPEGGQKTVYVVYDSALDRECALALIKTDAMEPQEIERFRREARAMARLDHPNVVALHDIGEDGGRPFFVCQYIAGGDLRGALRDAGGPLPIERTLSIAEDLCRALAFAHGHGIVHRDVKPANIWLTSDGTAKLGDFGLAIAVDQSRVTLAGTVVGTAAYMAPEQALGGEVDARSDLYSLGCVLYELLTGRPPFLGDDALAVISQHVNTAPVAASWHNADLPRALDALITRLLEKAPDERPQSAQAVLDELRRIATAGVDAPAETAPLEPRRDLAGIDWGRFVGRREELEQLKGALEDGLSGKGSLAMLAGEPGIGKTRLAEEFAVYAGLRGAQVLSGRCYEGEASLPYRPFVEALRQYTRSRQDEELRRQLGPGAPEIATLVSEIRARFPDIEEAPKLDGEAERLRLFESVTEFLHNAATAKPVVLFLDDLHWADKPSLLLLQHLAQRTARERLLIVGAYRDMELDRTHPLSETLGALRRLPNYRRVLLRGLSQESVIDLLTVIDPGEENVAAWKALAAALYQETEGNPFFIREVMAHLIETGKIVHDGGRWVGQVTSISELGIPEGVREVVGRRLSHLSEGCNRMLTLASTMAGGFSWEALKAICADVPEPELLDLLEETLAAQLIAERKDASGTYDFTHALIRQTLYGELSTPRRVLLHRQIGEALEQLYAANVEPHLAELAHHFYQAAPGGDVEKAIDYAKRAGDRAFRLYAWEEAAGHYERALEAMELLSVPDERRQMELHLALGDARWEAGDFKGFRGPFARAADSARGLADAATFARAALGLATLYNPGVGAVDRQAIGLLEEALDLLPPGDSALRAMVTVRLAHAFLFSDEREAKIPLAQEALAMARRVGDEAALTYTLACLIRFSVADGPFRHAQLTGLIDEALRLAEETGNKRAAIPVPRFRVLVSLWLGERDLADAAIDVEKRLTGELRTPGGVSMYRAMQARLDGRLDALEARVQQGLADEAVRTRPEFGGLMFDLRRAQGRLGELEAGLRGLVTRFPSNRPMLALVYKEQDRREEARAVFDELAADSFASLDGDLNQSAWIEMLAEVCCYLDDGPRAVVLYEKLLPWAAYCIMLGFGICTGSASLPLGALATTLGRFDDAERHFEDAIAMNRKLRAPTWVAEAQLGYARMLVKRGAPGDRERALELLQPALDAAQEMGMAKLVEDALTLQAQAQDGNRRSR